MTSSHLDLSQTDIPRQIQGNFIAYMRLFAGLPGMVMEDSDVFWFISHKPAPGNVILRAHWPDDHVEKRIDALYTQIGQHLEAIDWLLFPGDQPADLGVRLEARGMPGGAAGHWLWMDLTQLSDRPAVTDAFHIKQVVDDDMMREWTDASKAGFEAEVGWFYDAYARHGYGSEAFSLHYIGYLNDMPVTSGTLLDAGGGATIYDISTLPSFRGQGFGSAITYFLMQEIRSRGYTDTWIWSSSMAKSVYQKLGYVDADFGIREHTWHK